MRMPLTTSRPPRVPAARHQPECTAHEECGGRYRCVACGTWVGYCEGVGGDQNTCADCWNLTGSPPQARYTYIEFERAQVSRNRYLWVDRLRVQRAKYIYSGVGHEE